MCRGLSEANHGGSSAASSPVHEEDDSPRATGGAVSCELCRSQATMYCQADDAFLCRDCDKWVHGANFLAKRHIRCILCSTCHNLTQKYLIGSSVQVMLPSIVSLMDASDERQSCNSRANQKCSSRATLKRPFLFI